MYNYMKCTFKLRERNMGRKLHGYLMQLATLHSPKHFPFARLAFRYSCGASISPRTPTPSRSLFAPAEEAFEAAVRIAGDVLRRRRQQRRVQRLLRTLVQLEERRHPPLPAADGGRGGDPEPLRQLQLVGEEGGPAGPAESPQEPENTEVGLSSELTS